MRVLFLGDRAGECAFEVVSSFGRPFSVELDLKVLQMKTSLILGQSSNRVSGWRPCGVGKTAWSLREGRLGE
jgi:hypothetical protein